MRHIEGQIVQSVPDEEMIEGCSDCCIFAGRSAGWTIGTRHIKSQIYKSVPGGDCNDCCVVAGRTIGMRHIKGQIAQSVPAETAMIVFLQEDWYDRL